MKNFIKLGLGSLFSFMSLSSAALAQTGCSLNGQPIPCDDAIKAFGAFGGALMGFMAVIWIIGLIGFIFWLIMLIHAATKPIENKALWIVILVLFNLLGAIVYYFVVKKNFVDTTVTQNPSAPNVPPVTPPQA